LRRHQIGTGTGSRVGADTLDEKLMIQLDVSGGLTFSRPATMIETV
jgi:hypothetical protein